MLQRIGLALVGTGLALILMVVAVLMTDGLTPGRIAPLYAALTAAGAGLALVLGLRLLERGRDQHSLY
ncbi:hypothetical protein [Rhodovarius lipocyclicus]|uniref:hypothetical protein n=1 Tax=Rhodovarius lipocyclicus TaxID=268410 RepID=UPI00135B1755|nr:hypothetical protein [Rhodovarius lipocyclicus]